MARTESTESTESTDSTDSWGDGSRYSPEAVRFFDIAHEGAQLRNVAEQLQHGLFERVGVQPRSLVVVAGDHISHTAARLGAALQAPYAFPVVVAKQIPRYVSALDVVLVVTERRQFERLANEISVAANKGVPVVLAAGGEGPLQNDAPASVITVPPLPAVQGPSPARVVALVHVLAQCFTQESSLIAEALSRAAEEVDDELLKCSPERDILVNPARQLAEAAMRHSMLHTGVGQDPSAPYDPDNAAGVTSAIAELMATLWSAQGVLSSYLEHDTLQASMRELDRRYRERGRNGTERDVFYDPFIDGDAGPTSGDGAGTSTAPAALPLKVLVWGDPTVADPVAQEGVALRNLDLAATLRLVTRGFAASAFF
ncbi:hypothetical protein NQ024_01965 [Corynebacterium sp. 35RC1]|nr:hypothetical protein [Corynebacterium sp. 35RC1]